MSDSPSDSQPISEQSEYAYDAIPYRGSARFETHPDGLATRATLFGLQPPPIENARVLEIGCGDGGNLISIAQTLPGSTCLGIDLSETQIGLGREIIDSLQLGNIQLEQNGVDDLLNRSDESWDYIICHGVYSWVSPEIQQRILEVIKRFLPPNGVAFLSYNSYPGWHLREMIRNLMLFHSEKIEDRAEQVTAARQIIDGLIQSVPGYLQGYANFLRDEQNLLNKCQDFYIAHEHLSEENQPVYFRDLVRQLEGQHLQYLCEANLSSMFINRFPPGVGQMIKPEASVTEVEQYLDFVQMRMFRQTLICHSEAEVNRNIDPAIVRSLYASAYGVFDQGPPPQITDQPESYQGTRGANLTTSHPIAKAGLLTLAENWPRRIPFDELVSLAREKVIASGFQAGDAEAEESILAETLLAGGTADILDLHVSPGAYVCELSEKPVASSLARHQAAEASQLTSLRHTVSNFDDLAIQLIRLMNGENNREALIEETLKTVEERSVSFQERGVLVTDATRIRQIVEAQVDQRLNEIARSALLSA